MAMKNKLLRDDATYGQYFDLQKNRLAYLLKQSQLQISATAP